MIPPPPPFSVVFREFYFHFEDIGPPFSILFMDNRQVTFVFRTFFF